MIELLVVIAIIAILAAILFPVFSRAKAAAKKAESANEFRQIGVAMYLYLSDHDDRMPDRRDLKTDLPGGYKPWTGWPPSDPRTGWAREVLGVYAKGTLFAFPATKSAFGDAVQVQQQTSNGENALGWMWRFDRPDDPIPGDNFWGKSPELATEHLIAENNPFIGVPTGVADVELAVEPYFPRTVSPSPLNLRGRAVHFGGRNRLFLDGHVKFLRDVRTDP
ncbi:MAG: hypothetical protein KF812_00495 [Fimbriimonadaceae bacterium]|nr:hypothetical protein [Fimbriimonadaceae bacterium]